MTNLQRGLSSLLDHILAKASDYAVKGQRVAEKKLDIPEAGTERDTMLDGMKKGALASAVLVGLFGTKTGRSLTGTALKLGSLAALGTVAYKGYQNWKSTGDPLHAGQSVTEHAQLSSSEAKEHSLVILKALVAASYADGHLDDKEVGLIRRELIEMHLPESLAHEVEAVLESPLTAVELSALVQDAQMASQVYVATRLIIGNSASAQEKGYLSDLTSALEMDDALVASLESELG